MKYVAVDTQEAAWSSLDLSERRQMHHGYVIILMLTGSFLAARSTLAQEGTHYTPGVFNIQDFAVPPPGVYLQNFMIGYTTDEFKNRDGDRVRSVDLGNGPVPVDIDLDVFVVFPAVYWITDMKILGGDYGVVLGVPLQNVDISATLPTLGINADEDEFGVGDIMVQPVMLGWHRDRWDYMAGYIFYPPYGKYNENAVNNLGLGYWTHEVQASVVYRAGKDRLWTAAGMLTYDIHSKREGVDITPGDTFTFEWGVSRIFPSTMIELGLTGYNQGQVTDDDGSDVTRDPDIHDEVHAIGVQLSWTSQSQKLNLALRYLKEFEAVDRFEGDLGVFTITYAF